MLNFRQHEPGRYGATAGSPTSRRYTVEKANDGVWSATVYVAADGPMIGPGARPRICHGSIKTMREAMLICHEWEREFARDATARAIGAA